MSCDHGIQGAFSGGFQPFPLGLSTLSGALVPMCSMSFRARMGQGWGHTPAQENVNHKLERQILLCFKQRKGGITHGKETGKWERKHP